MKLKSDLKHTMSARAWAKSREEKARGSLKVAEVELQCNISKYTLTVL